MKFHCLGSNYCPFSQHSVRGELYALGFQESSIFACDFIVVRNYTNAKNARWLFPFKNILVWTHEPRYDSTNQARIAKPLGKAIYVFNVYTGNVFWHNRHFLSSYHYDEAIDLGLKRGRLLTFEEKALSEHYKNKKMCVAIYTRKKADSFNFHVNGQYIDLTEYRQLLASRGHEMGLCEIAGSGWGDMAFEDSGYKGSNKNPWWERKIDLLRNYRFNLAFENTNWPYYITEKIWQSIYAGCLPVYWGKSNTIYESFDQGSFVDASLFDSPDELWRYLASMTQNEWLQRMTSCVDSYNREMEKLNYSGAGNLAETVQRIRNALLN